MEFDTIEGLLRNHAAMRPAAPMATFDGLMRSYGEVHVRSSRIANALAADGIGPGDRIAVVARNSHPIFETLFAARKIGAVQVAVNWRLSPDEMRYILADAGATVVFAGPEFVAGLAGILPELQTGTRIIVLGGPEAGFAGYEDWLAGAPDTDPGHVSGADDTALQLYTSGTTGRPKGVLLMNRSLFSFIRAAHGLFGASATDVHVQALPLFHVGGINWSLQAFAAGAHCIAFSDFDADTVLAGIERSRASHLMTVPAVIQLLLARKLARTTDFSSLRVICYGGSTIPEKVLRDAIETFACGMYGMYGATELSFGATILRPEEHVAPGRPDLLQSCGRPLDGTEIAVMDPASLKPVAPGTRGEIWFRSPQLASGYWQRPDATASSFLPGGWYRTGDVGLMRDGYVYVSDRLDDMIVSGGENIYPAEIERVLSEHPDVMEVVAFGVPHALWGEAVHAMLVLREDVQVDEAELVTFTRARLASFKCPKGVTVAESLPRNPAGKVQRALLRRRFREAALQSL